MNPNTNQRKKIIYALAIVILFGGMFRYSAWLTKLKRDKDLGEAAIGQVDAGSFMMKLFLLGGFRGIVADILWLRAEENKRDHDWDRLKTNVELITKLQPHFLSIWTFQGWNLAYNVSVEWDAPEDKYEWIKQGIKFVQEGVEKNRHSPDLVWDSAWFYYHKLGFADEAIILRRLFRDDEEYGFKTYLDPETSQPVVGDDNFKLGYGWFSRAVGMVDRGENRLLSGTSDEIQYVDATPQKKGRPDDIAFRSMPAHGQTRYAAAVEKMSVYGVPARFGEFAKNEWAGALREWVKLGSHPYMSHNEIPRNGKLERDEIRIDDSTDPERYNKLNDNQKYWTARWADQMNYRYWKDRCRAEMTDQGVKARSLFYDGTVAYKTGDFVTAAAKFKEGLQVWKHLLDEFPAYRDDELNKKDTGLIASRYLRVLKQLGDNSAQDFPFKDLAALVQNDKTPDPFDVLEMLGVVNDPTAQSAPAARPSTAPAQPAAKK